MAWQTFLQIVEIRTKIVSLSTFFLALASSIWVLGVLPWDRVAVLFVAVLAVDMGTTAFNTFFDFERGVDVRSTNRESDKVLVHQRVAPGLALLVAVGLFALASVLGVFLALKTGWPLLVLGGVSLLVAFRYSGGKTPISSTAWGELFAGFFLGTVLWVVVAYVSAGAEHWSTWDGIRYSLYSLPSFLFIASILTVNNCCDREGDRAAGRRTLAILWGPAADQLVLLLPLAAYVSLAVLCGLGFFPSTFWFVAVIGPFLTLPIWRGMFRRGFRHETKGPNMGAVSQSFVIYSALCLLGWLLGFVMRV